MYIAIEGCSHGELDVIYATVERAEQMSGKRLDLLICCGDFQSVRNPGDLKCMAVPTKYMTMQSFYKYYSGEKKAPVLTIFIGGNHEASNYLQELPYGGWVAPNIYYLGYGGVVNVGGLRIGGVSGIYKGHDYLKGRFEKAPYTDSTIRSVYHVRNLEVFRMKQLHQQTPLDIFLSHDWPRGVTSYGDADALCRKKPFFKDEVSSDSLGSRSAQELLQHMKPRFWFAGHLHVKFAAVVGHEEDTPEIDAKSTLSDEVSAVAVEDKKKSIVRHTRFLALDKCLPRRDFLQVLDIKFACKHRCQNGKAKGSSHLIIGDNKASSSSTEIKDLCFYDIYDNTGNVQLYHDLEWLTVLRLTNHLQKITPHAVYMPGPGGSERYQFTPTDEELKETLDLMNKDLSIKPDQFCATAPAYDPDADAHAVRNIATVAQPEPVLNPYTADLCSRLVIDDPIAVMLGLNKGISKRQSFMVTPKRLPTAAEMNVTLNTSKLSSRDDAPGSDDESGGDIVFEVSISSDSDGCSKGVLSPIVTPLRNGARGARKSLLLSTPQRSGTLSDAVLSSTPSSSTALLKAASGDSASDHSPSISPFCSLPASPLASLIASPLPSSNSDEPGASQSCSADLEGSECSKSSQRSQSSDGEMEQPVMTSRSPLKLSAAHNSNSSEDVLRDHLNTSGSPKRLLPEDELVIDAETRHTIEPSSAKPFKIRRRNAAIYEAAQDEEPDYL